MQTVQYKPESVNYIVAESQILESGFTLQNLQIYYTTYGELNPDKSNVVWVFHALTVNSNPVEWWSGLVGEGFYINPEEYFVVCANILGSCYGSTGPSNFSFPHITIRDLVKAHKLLSKHLEIEKIKIGIGASMGGQQLLQWAVEESDMFECIVPIATNAKHSPWGIAFNEAQRMALQNSDLKKGLAAARAIALLSYRGYETFEKTQLDLDDRKDNFSSSLYQQYQGVKLSNRFSPYSYYYLSKAMDSHNVGAGFGGLENALNQITAKAVIIGINSDILFPPKEQEFIANHISNSSFSNVSSNYGHDGFLIETSQITRILEEHL